MPLATLLTRFLLVLLLVGATGCGGDSDDSAKRGTATPTKTPTATATATGTGKVDVKAVNRARDRLIAACKSLAKTSGDQAKARTALRRSAGAYLTAFEAAPDAGFRRSKNSSEITMRELLKATASYMRTSCGKKPAASVARRLRRAAARDTTS